MAESKLIELSYFDPGKEVRLTTYADTIIMDRHGNSGTITALRFGGYPEVVQAMADAIYGGASVDAVRNGQKLQLIGRHKGYRRQISHDGVYAIATLMASDDTQTANSPDDEPKETMSQPRKCYIFCPEGDRDKLFDELDHKTAAPLIPEFRDYMLDALTAKGDLRKLDTVSLKEKLEAWVLNLRPDDANIVKVLEDGLKSGAISIPTAVPGESDGFDGVDSVTSYLNTFGTTVAQRIREQFTPLFDPATDQLSEEVLAINDYVHQRAGYSLYDAQLAVAEATKRQLQRKGTALIIAECGSGKTKIGSTALGALYGMQATQNSTAKKSFGLVMCPSHVTKKWVREIGETLPNTFAMVVKSIADLERLYSLYEMGDKTVYAVLSKERARDGYMRYPAVNWNRRKKGFTCPDCGAVLQMQISDDGAWYMVNADQFFFQAESRKNHACPHCGSMLWAPVNPSKQTDWVKIGGYGWVYRHHAAKHLSRTKNEKILSKIEEIVSDPNGYFPAKGAQRRFPLSTYIKKKFRGRIGGLLCDELHEYNNASGQGDAMAELYGTAKLFVGMTATLINGYSSGIFHLLYRLTPGLMEKDGQGYHGPSNFDAEYGVIENTYEVDDGGYNSNRRTNKRKIKSRKLPGVSPLVYSRFLLEYASFLSLMDMNKDLPDYEEIPVPLEMPAHIAKAYKDTENILSSILKQDKKIAQKILSSYLGLLTVYPDQPYDQPSIVHPIEGYNLVTPPNEACFDDELPKEEKAMEIVRKKIAAGERVLIYTSWTRTDSQQKLLKLLCSEGYRTDILTPKIPPEKREAWVEKQVDAGLQVLITNPKCVETGLDLNAFTTLIFYSMGYNLFTLRQASRRSWRINQTAPRVEVYMLYYADTMQAKAMKLMASKLAVAGIIEGTLSDEGLAAMSDVQDMTSQMAKELAQGIKDNVEDIAAAFKRMAIINPNRKAAPVVQNERQPAVVLPSANVQPPSAKQVAVYDGLLQRTLEEQQKKRRPKTEISENQITLFDVA